MRILTAVAIVCSFLFIGAEARADIITALQSSPVAVSGGYQYTYSVTLSGGQLDSVSNGSPVQFGTVYDFGANTFIGATGLLDSSFTFSFANSDASASLTNPFDDPNLLNIRFTYTGTDNIVVDGNTTTMSNYDTIPNQTANLGTFTVISPFQATTSTNYDGQSYKGTNNSLQSNVGYLSAPLTPSAVTPEPSSLMLLGTGLLSAAAAMRRRLM